MQLKVDNATKTLKILTEQIENIFKHNHSHQRKQNQSNGQRIQEHEHRQRIIDNSGKAEI